MRYIGGQKGGPVSELSLMEGGRRKGKVVEQESEDGEERVKRTSKYRKNEYMSR